MPTLRRTLLDAVTTPGVRLVEVDLTAVTFLDCATIGALVGGANTARGRGVILRVVGASGGPLRLLHLAGVLRLLSGPGVSVGAAAR